jgi:hypothetical protein
MPMAFVVKKRHGFLFRKTQDFGPRDGFTFTAGPRHGTRLFRTWI